MVLQVLKTNTILLLLTKCNFTNKRWMVLQVLKTNTIHLLLFANKRSIGSWIIPGVPFTTGKSFTWSQWIIPVVPFTTEKSFIRSQRFLYLTHFRASGQKSKNDFVRFLVQMRTRKFAFEIYWPLLNLVYFVKSFMAQLTLRLFYIKLLTLNKEI